MTKKISKPKKAKLKRGVDATDLVEKLEKLLNDGQSLMELPVIDERRYDNWYENVLAILLSSFTDSDNEYKSRFVGPASYIHFSQDGVPSIQPDLQFELKRNIGEQLTCLDIIIDDIQIHFCKKPKTAEKQHI